MKNNYYYLDRDYSYADPETGVLRNLKNITNDKTLTAFEATNTAKRARELAINPIHISDSSAICAIHRHLFQDIYKWAGEKRTVEISKSGNPFFPLAYFNRAISYIDQLISDFKKIKNTDTRALSHKLAEILDTVNHLHPFREWNGRTQRECIRVLALEKGYALDLNPPDNKEIYEQYMTGTINGDIKALEKLIFDSMQPELHKTINCNDRPGTGRRPSGNRQPDPKTENVFASDEKYFIPNAPSFGSQELNELGCQYDKDAKQWYHKDPMKAREIRRLIEEREQWRGVDGIQKNTKSIDF